MKRDRVFVLVMGIVLVAMTLFTIEVVSALFDNPTSVRLWMFLTITGVGIIAWMWRFREYKREMRREQDETETD